MASRANHIAEIYAGPNSSAVGLYAYVMRAKVVREIGGDVRDHTSQAADLIDAGVVIPEGAPIRYLVDNGAAMFQDAERAEWIYSKKAKAWRWAMSNCPRGLDDDPNRAFTITATTRVLGLPKELSDLERKALIEDFIRDQILPLGVGSVYAIHRPRVTDDGDNGNFHAHIISTVRVITEEGLGNKFRAADGTFSRAANGATFRAQTPDDELHNVWAEYQNRWFRDHGIEISVDPPKLVAEMHVGSAAWHAPESGKKAANEELKQAAREAAKNPATVLDALTRMRSTFTTRDVRKYLLINGLESDELATVYAGVFRHPECAMLYCPLTGEIAGYFTTWDVVAQDRRVLEFGRGLAATLTHETRTDVIEDIIAANPSIRSDQKSAFVEFAAPGRLKILQGDPGTGKSWLLNRLSAIGAS
jgi:hypothetical protein